MQRFIATSSALVPIAAVIIALVVVHGFGRFVYTALIPLFVSDGLLTLNQAAQLATWNYVGYLTGAMLALFAWQRGYGRPVLLGSLLANAGITAIQVSVQDYDLLALLRLFNGISNGIVFVLAPALVLEWLVKENKAHLSGLMYLGVGGGLLLSSLSVELTQASYFGSERWLPAAWAAVPLAIISGVYLYSLGSSEKPVNPDDHSALWDKSSTPLFLSYAGAGLGYILPMTFLPAVAKEWEMSLTPSAWLITAMASIPAIFIWNNLSHKWGDRNALILNYAIQASAILALLALDNTALGLWLCALLMGGSFLGAVFLTQRLARNLHPHQGPRLSAALVALYGVTQLAGPVLADLGMSRGAALSDTFIWGLAACLWALLFMLKVPDKR